MTAQQKEEYFRECEIAQLFITVPEFLRGGKWTKEYGTQ
jgi:hypothetical protein